MTALIPRHATPATDPTIDVYLRWLRPLVPAACAVGFAAGWYATGDDVLLRVGVVLVIAALLGVVYGVASSWMPLPRLLATSVLLDGVLIAAMVAQTDAPSRFGTAYMWTLVVAGLVVSPRVTLIATAQAILFLTAIPWLAGESMPSAELVTKVTIFAALGVAFAVVRSRQIDLATNLERSRRQLTEAQRVAGIGSWEWQPDTGELTWSEEMYRLWGVEPGTPVTFELFQSLLSEDDRTRVLGRIAAAIEQGERYDVDLRFTLPDGEPGTMRSQGALLTDSTGRTWMVGTSQDVTELRRVERVQNEFVASASHELRTPATIVYGFADTLLERWTELGEEMRIEFVRQMHSGATRLGALIEDLLHVTRVEARQVRPDPEQVDVGELVQLAASELADERIMTEVDAEAVAWIDPSRLRQVVDNLLVNARRYATMRIMVRVDRSEDIVRVVVDDDGPGIPVEDRERVFQRFVRLEDDGATEGTGLGLYLARQLMDLCDGTIQADASPFGGARFTVTAPAMGAAPAACVSSPPACGASRDEDDPAVAGAASDG